MSRDKDFFINERIGLSDEQRRPGKALVQEMDNFSEKRGGNLVARELLASLDWEDIRSTARAFVVALKGESEDK